MITRRDLIKGGAFAAVATMVLGEEACKPKDLTTYDQIVLGVLRELQPLLPSAAALISKAITILQDFDAAYKRGAFADAMALFANLSSVIGQIAADAGVNNPTVKVALAVAGIALRAIAVLLASQSGQPAVHAVLTGAMNPEKERQRELIRKLSDESAINKIFAEAKP